MCLTGEPSWNELQRLHSLCHGWRRWCILSGIQYFCEIPSQNQVDQLMKSYEFKNLYQICNRKWGEYSKDLKEENFHFWEHILSFYSISHPNLCKLVQIVFSVAGNTGPFERSYSRSAKLCYKDCNKLSTSHMSTQYILSLLKDFAFNYTSARELMESSLVINI